MKTTTKLLLALFCITFLTSCAKLGGNCGPSEFLGTWKGTATCSQGEEQATVTIFQNSDGTFLTRYSGIVLPTTLESCSVSGSGASGFGDLKTNYSINGDLEDEVLSVTIVTSGVKNKTCTVDLIKE
ncbi:hypothetical protein [Portibacter lacus]|uniref:Lipocalin-like domain-containing protein n=1 Tax=Portibacter lacus TaxID=1099794 RepID=A0AA37SPY2_9BACT|nr:hypothetical protein [Portibacter lacus]GLR17347.1 hypothetical protein GCM10007940_19620 [Portibacter lacus]